MNSVDRVMGRLFDARRRIGLRGAQEQFRPSVKRIKRAGARHGMAVFKVVGRGGTTSPRGLRGQMNYVFNPAKVAALIDPSGRLERHDEVSKRDRDNLIRDWASTWKFTPRTGNTTHMILSFPSSVRPDLAEQISRDVLDEMLQHPDKERFEYVGAMHVDTGNPHTHVIVNRRGDEGRLFTLRRDTALSYESFRECMAEKALAYGVHLDPTFRFERGITDRQPSPAEQRAAQAEGRAPRQRPRVGADLKAAEDLISMSSIAYSALAVIAHNSREADDLAEHYANISNLLMYEKGGYTMPELSTDETERFDQYLSLTERAIGEVERELAARDPAARVKAEIRLSEIIHDYTQLNPDADHAKLLHQRPAEGSLYMHAPGMHPERLHDPETRAFADKIERDYGLNAEAVLTRLCEGAPNAYVERQWLYDDLEAISDGDRVEIQDREEIQRAAERLNDAHFALREYLVEREAIERLPYVEDQRRARPDAGIYTYEENREERDLEAAIATYREQCAPEEWLEAMREGIREDIRADRSEDEAEYLSRHPNAASQFAFDPRDPNAAIARAQMFRERAGGVERVSANEVSAIIRADNPEMPFGMTDRSVEAVMQAVAIEERERVSNRDTVRTPAPSAPPERLAFFQARSKDAVLVTNNYDERKELRALIKDNTTADQYERAAQGDLDGLSHLTRDPLFARQLVHVVVAGERKASRAYTPDQERLIAEHATYVRDAVERDRDRDRGRDDGYER